MRRKRKPIPRGSIEPLEPRTPMDASLTSEAGPALSAAERLALVQGMQTNATFIASAERSVSGVEANQGTPDMPRQRAFPGAEGWGAFAQGGRGGDVYHVTNLKDAGVGSLRYGINSARGPRTIVFDVGGTINLRSRLVINKPFLTIAGQTAPGTGVTTQNYGLALQQTHDVVIRYMRFRPGDQIADEHDTILIYESHDVIIDHVSASWSTDEIIDVTNSHAVTIQWSIISEGLHNSHHHKGPHSAGLLSSRSSVTLHHNLFAHNDIRNPRVRQQADIVNNVIYNWGIMAASFGWSADGFDPWGATQANLQSNYFLAGPSTKPDTNPVVAYHEAFVWADGNATATKDKPQVAGQPLKNARAAEGLAAARHDFPKVRTESALVAYRRVLADAGASIFRDSVDRRIVRDISNATGRIIDTPKQVNAFSNAHRYSVQQHQDSDEDGMADTWEFAQRLNPFAADSWQDFDADGWTNLEEYLDDLSQGLVPPDYLITGSSFSIAANQSAMQYRPTRSYVAGAQEILPPFAANQHTPSGRRITLASYDK